jgi:hypothetical protein
MLSNFASLHVSLQDAGQAKPQGALVVNEILARFARQKALVVPAVFAALTMG